MESIVRLSVGTYVQKVCGCFAQMNDFIDTGK